MGRKCELVYGPPLVGQVGFLGVVRFLPTFRLPRSSQRDISVFLVNTLLLAFQSYKKIKNNNKRIHSQNFIVCGKGRHVRRCQSKLTLFQCEKKANARPCLLDDGKLNHWSILRFLMHSIKTRWHIHVIKRKVNEFVLWCMHSWCFSKSPLEPVLISQHKLDMLQTLYPCNVHNVMGLLKWEYNN